MFDFTGNIHNAGLVRAELRGCDPLHRNCGGWWLSDFDTWEQCPVCYHGQQHPESVATEEMAQLRWEAMAEEDRALDAAARRAEAQRAKNDRAREVAEQAAETRRLEEEWAKAQASGEPYIPF